MSCLEVDAAISNPADMTLEQVDHLSLLEPYGSGNPRPVFALLGATVDSVQQVGQGKHLNCGSAKAPAGLTPFSSPCRRLPLSWSRAAG